MAWVRSTADAGADAAALADASFYRVLREVPSRKTDRTQKLAQADPELLDTTFGEGHVICCHAQHFALHFIC